MQPQSTNLRTLLAADEEHSQSISEQYTDHVAIEQFDEGYAYQHETFTGWPGLQQTMEYRQLLRSDCCYWNQKQFLATMPATLRLDFK